MALDPRNPLSAIGLSNDPSLTARTVNADKAATDLQSGLAQITARGQNERENTSLAGRLAQALAQSNMYRTANIDPNSNDALAQLANRRNTDIGKSEADIFSKHAAGSLAAGQTGILPLPLPKGSPPVPVGKRVGPNALTIDGIPLGTAAATAGNPTVKKEGGKVRKVTDIVDPNTGKSVSALAKRELTDSESTSTTDRSPANQPAVSAISQRALGYMQQQNPQSTIEFIRENATQVIIEVDGVGVTLNKKGK